MTPWYDQIDVFMSFPILVKVLAASGLFFTFRTRGVQIRQFVTACKLIVEKPASSQKKRRLNPVFRARDIGLDETTLQHWKD